MSECGVSFLDQYSQLEKIYHANDTIAPDMLYDLYMKLNSTEIEMLAHRPTDMIKECHWDGQKNEGLCQSFQKHGGTKIFVPKYGVCYTFNFKGMMTSSENNDSAITNFAGAEHGLQLILDIESKNVYNLLLFFINYLFY